MKFAYRQFFVPDLTKPKNSEKQIMVKLMKLYFAPLEGITTYTYRNIHKEFFGGCDEYFAPFITPSANEKVSIKSLRDIMPENNRNLQPAVQVMANQPEAFLNFEEKIKELGYTSVNLNFGCPSSTVVKKNRGAGALLDIEKLDNFLKGVFEKSSLQISVKTRIGFFGADEMQGIMAVYNKYPISRLIVHPRTRQDYYSGIPDMAAFEEALCCAKMPVCYNGNIFSVKDFEGIRERFGGLDSVMIGRGAISNPAIFREIKGGEKLKTRELVDFTKALKEKYLDLLGSEIYTLHKLKEIWIYNMWNYPDEKKLLKAIKKSNRLADLICAIECLPEL
ncbi:MAG: tRNA-dihydrouridine synthase family protein [Clostridia bacterium]|nr:tRNA-dihydrouridine synthase family protein [Clostridia bacterium]